jgi:NTP pyrophosphatase (non-canonical NTP hydrolase)
MDLLSQLREVNTARCARWHGPGTEPWSGADWSNAMCGEAGEAANVVKKLRRWETGTGAKDAPDPQTLREMLGEELADTIIYADLLAAHYEIDLRGAIVLKFNSVSAREGFTETLTWTP